MGVIVGEENISVSWSALLVFPDSKAERNG